MQFKKQQKNEAKFERELKGPYAYDRFNTISRICQNSYLNFIRVQNILLILLALLSSCTFIPIAYDLYVRYILVALSIIVLGIIIFQQTKNYMSGWQNGRFIAESVLSNAWLYSFKIGSYNNSDKIAKTNFVDNVTKIESEVELKNFLSIYDSKLPLIADWMEQLFNELDIINKKQFYIVHRLEDQINWYTKKSQYNRRQASKWFVFSLVLLLIGIILTLVIQSNYFSVLGFLSTVIAAILTWRQTKRFDELKVTYSVAARELHSLKTKFDLEKDEVDILKFVEEAEKSISREHKLWFNWTYIS